MDYLHDLPKQIIHGGECSICPYCYHFEVCRGVINQPCVKCEQFVDLRSVMPVVMCKDCKHRPAKKYGRIIAPRDADGYTDYGCPFVCEDSWYNRLTADDDYCSLGEKWGGKLMAKLPDDSICHYHSDDGITINVDFSPLVRCCDCFHSQHWHKNISMCFLWDKDGIEVFNDGFCNYGKKREES